MRVKRSLGATLGSVGRYRMETIVGMVTGRKPGSAIDDGTERRYDSEMLGKIVQLATRLQGEHQETLSAGQVETIGKELGLDPGFIRQAMGQFEPGEKSISPNRARTVEFWSTIWTLAIPLIWGALTFIFRNAAGLQPFMALVAPAPLAVLLGFLSGRRNVGSLAALELVLALLPSFSEPAGVFYLLVAIPLGRALAEKGADLREEYFPLPSARKDVSRQELLQQLFALENELESQKRRRTFVSVDVVGSSEMALNASELAVEYSFGEFQRWVQEVIASYDGTTQSVAGDGIMCLFESDIDAVRAAQRLQKELPLFNAERNRLPQPFRIRCGVSAGEVAIIDGAPIREAQSPALYRAALMQKRAEPGDIVVSGELAGTALLELGGLAQLSEDQDSGGAAFSWKAGQRAAQARIHTA